MSSTLTRTIDAAYREKFPASAKLYEQGRKVFPDGLTHDGRFLKPFPVYVEHAAGSKKYDPDGNEIIDGMASLWYCAIGHGRREMADAVAAQMSTLEAYSCFDPFTNVPADTLAAKLVSLCPIPDARVFLCGSGSESIDTAMKLGAHHPMGPLELADFIGLDTCLSVMQVLHEGLADSKYRPCPLLVKYVEAGWLGRKAQRGFYDYRGEKPVPTR